MTHKQFLRLLKTEVDKAPTRWRAAERLGCSESILSKVINEKMPPPSSLLARFGLVRRTVIVPDQKAADIVKRLTADSEINPG